MPSFISFYVKHIHIAPADVRHHLLLISTMRSVHLEKWQFNEAALSLWLPKAL